MAVAEEEKEQESFPGNLYILKHSLFQIKKRGYAYNILVGKPKGKNHLEYVGVNRRRILKWIHKKCNGKSWTQDRDKWQAFVYMVMYP